MAPAHVVEARARHAHHLEHDERAGNQRRQFMLASHRQDRAARGSRAVEHGLRRQNERAFRALQRRSLRRRGDDRPPRAGAVEMRDRRRQIAGRGVDAQKVARAGRGRGHVADDMRVAPEMRAPHRQRAQHKRGAARSDPTGIPGLGPAGRRDLGGADFRSLRRRASRRDADDAWCRRAPAPRHPRAGSDAPQDRLDPGLTRAPGALHRRLRDAMVRRARHQATEPEEQPCIRTHSS